MKLYSESKNYKLYQGNMLDMLEVIDENSIDSIITDPPYELNFMGKGWDNAGVSFQKETWEKCFKVLKDGGYLLAFGGSRTFHRIACAIEDAGFEIRDTILWLYGSGFPKSMNVGLAIDKKLGVESKVVGYSDYTMPDLDYVGKEQVKNGNVHKMSFGQVENAPRLNMPILEAQNQWNGWGSCLKPAFEPIIIARKPFKTSLVDNVLKNGVGALNIDECRIPLEEGYKSPIRSEESRAYAESIKGHTQCDFGGKTEYAGANANGRFPANVILTYDETDKEEVIGGFPNSKGSQGKSFNKDDYKDEGNIFNRGDYKPYNDEGSASRYFYCAKASKKDRDEGLDGFEEKKVNDGRQAPVDNAFQRGETPRKNTHPCVKPTTLLQYIIRLVSPKGPTILDCFNGSGSTGKAVMYENKERDANYKYIGIEMTEEYLPIAKARIEYVENLKNDKQTSLF